MFYAVVDPAGKPAGLGHTMSDAQELVASLEADVVRQSDWRIYPVDGPGLAERLNLKLAWSMKLEKIDEQTGEVIEIIESSGVE